MQIQYLAKTHRFADFRSTLPTSDLVPKDKHANALKRIEELETEATKAKAALETSAHVVTLKKVIDAEYKNFQSERNWKHSVSTHPELSTIYNSRVAVSECIAYSRLVFNQGAYEEAAKLVNILNLMVDDAADINHMTWAKLTCNLLLAVNGDAVSAKFLVEDFKPLRKQFETKIPSVPTQKVAQSCAFLYHALLTFFYAAPAEPKYDYLLELFLDERYISSFQIGAPSLLRYFVLLFVISYEKRSLKVDIKNLIALLKNNVCNYRDSFTELFSLLYCQFDLPAVEKSIKSAEFLAQVKADHLFSSHAAQIVENSKKLYFEVYCRIYSSVSVATVAAFLGKPAEEAELWIVNLVTKNNLKARFANDALHFGNSEESETLSKRAKELMSRNRILVNNVGKVLSSK